MTRHSFGLIHSRSSLSRFTPLLALALVVLAPWTSAAQAPLTLPQAIDEALSRNRGLLAARTGVTEAAEQAAAARGSRLPQINVAESWQRGNQPVFVFSSLLTSRQFAAANFAIDALNHPDPVGYFHTAVGVQQLVFDGGRLRAITEAASLQRDLAESQVREAEAGTRLAVTELYGRLVALSAERRALASALDTAQADLARARQRRDAGMASEADVLSFTVHVSDLQQRSLQSDGNAAMARAELNRLTGASVERDFVIVEPEPAPRSPADVAALIATAEQQRPELQRAAIGEALSARVQKQARAALVPQVGAQLGVDFAGTSFADRASSWVVGGEVRWIFSTGGSELARLRAAASAASRARIEREDAHAMVAVDVLSAVKRLDAASARVEVGRATVEQARESQRIIRDRFEAGMATVTDVLRAAAALLDAEAHRTAAVVDVLVGQALLEKAIGR